MMEFSSKVFILFALSVCAAQNFTNTRIRVKSGLHYEESGAVQLIRSEWQLATFLDVDKFISLKPVVDIKTIESLVQTCEKHSHLESCVMLIREDELLEMQKIVEKRVLEFQSIVNASIEAAGCNNNTRSTKFFNAIEKQLMKAMQNNQSDIFERKISDELDAVEVYMSKPVFYDVYRELQELKKRTDLKAFILWTIQETLARNSTNQLAQKQLGYEITMWQENVQKEMDQYLHYVQILSDTMFLAKRGVMHPDLLSVGDIESTIDHFLSADRKGESKFPLSKHQIGCGELLRIAHYEMGYANGQIIIVLSIPMIDPISYNLLRMYAYPTPQVFGKRLGSAYIEPTADYLLLASNHYTFASIGDISKCHMINDTYICKSSHPLYGIQQPSCETAFLSATNYSELYENCKIKISAKYKPFWTQIQDGWLYSLPQTDEINVVCNGIRIDAENITGSGVLQLKAGCKAITSTTILLGSQNTYKESVGFKHPVALNVTGVISSRYFSAIPEDDIELKAFQREIERNESLLSKMSSQNIISLSLVLSQIFIFFILFTIVLPMLACK